MFDIYDKNGTQQGTATSIETAVRFANAMGIGTRVRYKDCDLWCVMCKDESVASNANIIRVRIDDYERRKGIELTRGKDNGTQAKNT